MEKDPKMGEIWDLQIYKNKPANPPITISWVTTAIQN